MAPPAASRGSHAQQQDGQQGQKGVLCMYGHYSVSPCNLLLPYQDSRCMIKMQPLPCSSLLVSCRSATSKSLIAHDYSLQLHSWLWTLNQKTPCPILILPAMKGSKRQSSTSQRLYQQKPCRRGVATPASADLWLSACCYRAHTQEAPASSQEAGHSKCRPPAIARLYVVMRSLSGVPCRW